MHSFLERSGVIHLNTISVIVVNYNGKHLLRDCLESLFQQSFSNIEVILVDNASRDGSLEYVREAFPRVKIIPLAQNIGFAGANNEGLRHAAGDYIMLLNNDVKVDKDCLQNLFRAMDADQGIGIGATKMIAADSGVIDSAGDGISTALRGFKRGEGLSVNLYNEQEFVFGACAGAALYRRTMIEDVGFLDEDFFLIYEDTDLNLRAQLAGWNVLYVPSAIVFHKVRSTIKEMSTEAIYYSLRNSEFVRMKNVPAAVFLRCFPSYLLGNLIEFLYFAVKYRKFSLYVRAKWDAIKLCPRMMRKRRVLMKQKRVRNRQLSRIMTSCWHKEFFLAKTRKLFC